MIDPLAALLHDVLNDDRACVHSREAEWEPLCEEWARDYRTQPPAPAEALNVRKDGHGCPPGCPWGHIPKLAWALGIVYRSHYREYYNEDTQEDAEELSAIIAGDPKTTAEALNVRPALAEGLDGLTRWTHGMDGMEEDQDGPWIFYDEAAELVRESGKVSRAAAPADATSTANDAQVSHPAPAEGLDALRALSDAATPGPWERVTEGNHDQRHAAGSAFLSVMATKAADNPDIEFSDMTWVRAGFPNVCMVGNGPKQTENGDLIVAAVNYVRAALEGADRG